MDARKLRSIVAVLAVVVVVVLVAWQRESGTEAGTGGAVTNSETARRMPRVVDIGAGTCKACKEMLPILAELKTEFDGRAVVDVFDIREDKDAMEEFEVQLIPTQIFYDRDGVEVWRHVGFLAKAEIVKRLEELIEQP